MAWLLFVIVETSVWCFIKRFGEVSLRFILGDVGKEALGDVPTFPVQS